MPVEREFVASIPCGVKLSKAKLRDVCPELTLLKFWYFRYRLRTKLKEKPFRFLSERLESGDPNPAIVVSTEPLLVAAYARELDWAVLVLYPDRLREKYALKPKMKLLNVVDYDADSEPEDVVPGPNRGGRWSDFTPRIAEFLSDDWERIAEVKKTFESAIWERTWALGQEYKRRFPGLARGGNPIFSRGVRYR